MGILDDAIREHLELKRQHGADDSELKQLEDEAFGPAERPGGGEDAPDPLSEAPTEFMTQPDLADAGPSEDAQESGRRERAAGVLDLQEAPEPSEPAEEEQPAAEHEAIAEVETAPEEPPSTEEEEGQPAQEEPLGQEPEEEPSRQEAQEEPSRREEEPAGHSTEERHAIAEHPTELYDVEEEFSATASVRNEKAEAEALPSDDDEEEDDFFSEQRLSEELDQALDAPRDLESEEPEPSSPEPQQELRPDEDIEPGEEQGELEEEDEQPDFERQQPEPEEEPRRQATAEQDVLEGTPDFLEEAPEDDELWFEQKPPKDFDFDD